MLDIEIFSNNTKSAIFDRIKLAQASSDRSFLKGMFNGTICSADPKSIKKFDAMLFSDDPYQQCEAINFFTESVGDVDDRILTRIFLLGNNQSFEIMDCIDGFIGAISKCRHIVNNSSAAKQITDYLIFLTKSEENQFIVTALEAISTFVHENRDIAQYLLSSGFFHISFISFQKYINAFESLEDNDETTIIDILYLIQSLLRIFSSIFVHKDFITPEYSALVVSCFHHLLNVETPKSHILKLRTLVFDNVYWFAFSAPDESIQNLLSKHFLEVMNQLLTTGDEYMTSVFEAIAQIATHDDMFSILFVNIGLLDVLTTFQTWSPQCCLAFIKILRSFTACKDQTPLLALNNPNIPPFIHMVLDVCSFKAQQEAFIVISHIINSKQIPMIEFALSNFTDCFSLLPDFLDCESLYLCQSSLYSLLISLKFMESQPENAQNQFKAVFQSDEWRTSFEKLEDVDDDFIMKSITLLSQQLFE